MDSTNRRISVGHTYWIWYPGDFELYHAMKQNFSRRERNISWPAFWKSESFRNRVTFRRTYFLTSCTSFIPLAAKGTDGFVQVNGVKYPFGSTIRCSEGKTEISVHAASISSLPSVYLEGDTVFSGFGWTAEDYGSDAVPVSYSKAFMDPAWDPSEWKYAEKTYVPVSEDYVSGGLLFGFETELTAILEIRNYGGADPAPVVYFGETREEALDTERCYHFCRPDKNGKCERTAFSYAFIPCDNPLSYSVRAIHRYVDIPINAEFRSDDEELNRIFDVSARTLSVCSDVFFLDGAKRDRWIWGGDAYICQHVNRYLTADREIEKRTILALRGNVPVTTHINTILDYSLIWILSVKTYYESYGDSLFIKEIYPKIRETMDFLLSMTDNNGFITGRDNDWIFIDWAEIDRKKPVAAEQMLLYACLDFMSSIPGIIGVSDPGKSCYPEIRDRLKNNIDIFFWDSGKNAYIDSFASGKRNVTRHANIFAVVFDVASAERKKTIADHVLLNPDIPAITTPYFRFFELEAFCRLGYYKHVLNEIKSYWGGMLKMGAVTFWEEYDPDKPICEQYEMYGDPYGKSMCHAWSSSPVYFLARYFAGLKSLTPGGSEYEVTPLCEFFGSLDCTFPIGGRNVHIIIKNGKTSVEEL